MLLTANKDVRIVAECRRKKVNVATFAKLQPLPQFCNCCREVADGQIALADVCQHSLQVLFCEAARVLNHEGSTWEIFDEMGRNEQMAEGMQLLDTKTLTERILHASLQN